MPAGAPGSAAIDRARFLATALLVGGSHDQLDLSELEASVDELVSVWTPTLRADSRAELVSELLRSDDAIRDVVVTFTAASATATAAFLEWTATGRFSGPVLLHDDVLYEPTGAIVRAAGAVAATFHGARATRVCCYFDRLAMLEQLLQESTSGSARRSHAELG